MGDKDETQFLSYPLGANIAEGINHRRSYAHGNEILEQPIPTITKPFSTTASNRLDLRDYLVSLITEFCDVAVTVYLEMQ